MNEIIISQDKEGNVQVNIPDKVSWEFVCKAYAIVTQLVVAFANQVEPKMLEGRLVQNEA